MIIDIVLTIVILFLLVERYLSQKTNILEREKLMKMFMAKDLREVTDNEVLDKMPKQEPFKPSDEVSMDDAIEDDKLFDLHLEAVKKQAKEEFDRQQELTRY
jgi:hypothetical protein